MKNNISSVKQALNKFKDAIKTPEKYLRLQNEAARDNKLIVKILYDYSKSSANDENNNWNDVNSPSTLIVDDMDVEQIWQQLELQNSTFWSNCLKSTAKLLSQNDDKFQLLNKSNENLIDSDSQFDGDQNQLHDDYDDDINSGEDDNDLNNGSDDNDDDDDDDNSEIDEDSKGKTIFTKKSVVDDDFFNLEEMNKFLEDEDRKEMTKLQKGKRLINNNNEIDFFNDNFSSDSNDEDPKYSDFYEKNIPIEDENERTQRILKNREQRNRNKLEKKNEDLGLESDVQDEDDIAEDDDDYADVENDIVNKKLKVKFDLSKNEMKSDSENELNDDENSKYKSSYEQREIRLRSRIEELEEKSLGEKPWQLKGEIDSTSRPQNSLLEEILEFDSTRRPAPIITEKTTLQLEDIIKQRIKDKAWDDVTKKFQPINTPQEFRKKLVLDQEKSKESLAQIYEKEYLKEADKLDKNIDDGDVEEPKEHQEIRRSMKTLFIKLDALSNFYYTPKTAVPEVKIITNIPAINMEEVAPVAVSDATLLAPEEIKSRPKGDDIGKSERTKTDKNRERRQKKLKQKVHKKIHDRKLAEREALGLRVHEKDVKKDLLNKVIKNRNVEKMKINSNSKSLKSSKAFFSQLQDDSVINVGKNKRQMKIKDGNIKNAKKLKL